MSDRYEGIKAQTIAPTWDISEGPPQLESSCFPPFIHECGSQEHYLVNFMCAHLHLRLSFPGRPAFTLGSRLMAKHIWNIFVGHHGKRKETFLRDLTSAHSPLVRANHMILQPYYLVPPKWELQNTWQTALVITTAQKHGWEIAALG